jgi:hypothetical protein
MLARTFADQTSIEDIVSFAEETFNLFVSTMGEQFGVMASRQVHAWQEYFILSHELAHHALGHLSHCNLVARDELSLGSPACLLVAPSQLETEADDWTMGLCIDTFQRLRTLGLENGVLALSPFLLGSVDVLFQLPQYCEELTPESVEETTRPSSRKRRLALHRKYLGRFSAATIAFIRRSEEIVVEASVKQGGKMLRLLQQI